ncbi:MAG: peptidylprolyl isomerase, partial [Candidatus Hydrogenedens sp.]
EKTVSVSDKEIQDTYQRYVKSGWAKRITETYDFSNILIIDFTGDPEKEKKINEIYQRIQNGEDFFLLAQQLSEDPFSRRQGYCYYEMSLKQVLPEVKHYLITLPVGAVSPPFRTRNGWNILKVISRNIPGTIPFDKMKQGIYQQLIHQKVRDILKQELEILQKEITITYYQNYK